MLMLIMTNDQAPNIEMTMIKHQIPNKFKIKARNSKH